MMRVSSGRVAVSPLPATPSDIAAFLPTEEAWLAFVKCLVDDRVNDLRSFAEQIDWHAFLLSTDAAGSWHECNVPGDNSTATLFNNKMHPFPSNPFFVAIFYGASDCLLFMKESGLDFANFTEHGFNAYHNLMGALYFQSFWESNLDSATKTAAQERLLCLFHRHLFSRDEQATMLKGICRTGMAPLAWGVYLGLAREVENVVYQYSPMSFIKMEALGVNEHITLDVSKFTGTNTEFFTSPIAVLLDLYGESALEAAKEAGIFRRRFIWTAWTELLFQRNRIFAAFFVIERFMSAIALIASFGPKVNQFLANYCAGRTHERPVALLVTLGYTTAVATLSLTAIGIGVLRKERARKRVGYPASPRQAHADMLRWLLPPIIIGILSIFLFLLYSETAMWCQMPRSIMYSASGVSIILIILANMVQVICYVRLIYFFNRLGTSFFNSLTSFLVFVMFYLLLIAVFTRMFQSNSIFSGVQNNATAMEDSAAAFFQNFYRSFLVSLNIVDSNLFQPEEDRIDLVLTHFFFILFVPVLFINFVIGVLSMEISRVTEHDVEAKYLLMLMSAEFIERTFFFVRLLIDRIFGPPHLVLSICRPLSPHSKMLRFCAQSLEVCKQESSKQESSKQERSKQEISKQL